MVDLVRLLPAMVRALDDMVILLDPLSRIVTMMLDFGPVTDIAGGLLTVLLGYGALAKTAKVIDGLTGSVLGLSGATRGLAAAEAQEAAASRLPHGGGGIGGKGGKALLGVLGLGIAADSLTHNTSGDSTGGLLASWGQTAAGGALAGSAFGPWGVAIGAAGGLLAGTSKSVYDQYQANHPAHSQIWDPTKPGYGGYVAQGKTTSQDNGVQVSIGTLIATSDVDIQRALDDYQTQRARRQ